MKSRVYQMAMEIGEWVWTVFAWDISAKETVGKQLVKAADPVAENLSEGFGRFFYKENRQFGYSSRGSLYETRTWLTKAHNQAMINDSDFDNFIGDVDAISVRLNNYISSIGKQQNDVSKASQ